MALNSERIYIRIFLRILFSHITFIISLIILIFKALFIMIKYYVRW